MNIGIIGCGRVGHYRAKGLGRWTLAGCADNSYERAELFAAVYPQCKPYRHWQELVACKTIDAVVVATLHDTLSSIACAAVEAGKHVLVETPAARTPYELQKLMDATQGSKQCIRVGFNHRYHRGIVTARKLYEEGYIGDIQFIRARYGHGGRLEYNKGWHANPALSGGGVLIDQGIHLIDLAQWFLGEFCSIKGVVQTCFWDMPVDDNAFMLLQTKQQKTAFLHASCSEWKDRFSLELCGVKGKIDVCGLGSSYGTETITLYELLPDMGPPETTSWEFPMEDNSWSLELEEFYKDIEEQRRPSAPLSEAMKVHKVIEALYREKT